MHIFSATGHWCQAFLWLRLLVRFTDSIWRSRHTGKIPPGFFFWDYYRVILDNFRHPILSPWSSKRKERDFPLKKCVGRHKEKKKKKRVAQLCSSSIRGIELPHRIFAASSRGRWNIVGNASSESGPVPWSAHITTAMAAAAAAAPLLVSLFGWGF